MDKSNVNNLPAETKRQLVKAEELFKDVELAAKTNELNKLINMQPKKDWIKPGTAYNGNQEYIPVGIMEYIMLAVFGYYRDEVISYSVMANAACVHIRVHYEHPAIGWTYIDGLGAQPIQTEKGASAMDWGKVNNGAVQMALPAAKSYAWKDAVESLGVVFGKDLNRKIENTRNYDGMLDNKLKDVSLIPSELQDVINAAEDIEALDTLYKANPDLHANPIFFKAIMLRKNSLIQIPVSNGNNS